MKLSDVIAMQEELEAANMSQYGDTGWQYGRRSLAPATGYLPTRTAAGFPAERGPRFPITMLKPTGLKGPRSPLGRGTATGMKVSQPKVAKMVRPATPKISHPTMPKSPTPRMPKAPTVARPHLSPPATQGLAKKTLSGYGTSEGVEKGWDTRGRGHFATIDPYDTSVMREPHSKTTQPKSEFSQLVRSPKGSGIQRQWDEQDRVSKSRGWFEEDVEGYGTSEGVEKAWDTRGRGKKKMQSLPDGSVVGIRRGNRESRSLERQRIDNTPPWLDTGGRKKIQHPGYQGMPGKGPKLERYDEYLKYVESGEPQGSMSHDEWLKRNLEAEGEPIGGAFSTAHIDPVVWFHPPSLTKRLPNEETRIPTDDPREKNNKFGDVDKRNSKDTERFRMGLLKRKGPGGAPPMIPVRTTLVEPHSAVYMPGMQSAAENRMNRRAPRRGYTKYYRRGCI